MILPFCFFVLLITQTFLKQKSQSGNVDREASAEQFDTPPPRLLKICFVRFLQHWRFNCFPILPFTVPFLTIWVGLSFRPVYHTKLVFFLSINYFAHTNLSIRFCNVSFHASASSGMLTNFCIPSTSFGRWKCTSFPNMIVTC